MTAMDDVFAQWDAVEGIASAVAAARDGVDALLRDRGLRRTTPALPVESLLRGASASAELDGSSTDLETLREGRGDATAVAAARLNAGLLVLVPVVGRSPLQALARMHTLAAVDSVPDESLGRPRPDSAMAAELRDFSEALLRTARTPGIAVAALVMGIIILMIFRLAGFYIGTINEAVEMTK